jgi:hypothetical protein
VDATFSDGSSPAGTLASSIQTNVISLIDQVSQTLDIAVYNAGSTLIIEAIKRAVNRECRSDISRMTKQAILFWMESLLFLSCIATEMASCIISS